MGDEKQTKRAINIAGIPYDLTESDVLMECKKYGKVVGIRMPQASHHRNKGYVFVDFDNEEMATNAIKSLNGKRFWGRRLSVNWAKRHPGESGSASKPPESYADRGPQRRYDDYPPQRYDMPIRDRFDYDLGIPPQGLPYPSGDLIKSNPELLMLLQEEEALRIARLDRIRRITEETRRLYGGDPLGYQVDPRFDGDPYARLYYPTGMMPNYPVGIPDPRFMDRSPDPSKHQLLDQEKQETPHYTEVQSYR